MGFFDRVKSLLSRDDRDADQAARSADQPAEQAPHEPEGQQQPPTEAPTSTPADERHRTTTVQPGETWADVASRCEVDADEMARLNGLERPDLVYPGQVFKVPHD